MSTATQNQQPTPHSTLRAVVARHPVVAFLIMVYTIAWGVFLPVVLQGRGLLVLPIDLWRVGVSWYLIALFGFLVAMVLIASVFQGLAPLEALVVKWPLFFTLFLPEVLFPFLFIQIFEETGWTGFMQHTVQEWRGPLLASVLVAPAFALITCLLSSWTRASDWAF